MTTYYKGNNIGLNYNAAAGTWSFTNTPQDFIDPNAFSSPDPKFPTAPTTPTTPTEPEQDPCPAGYIYDNSLKQCVPDPNYQNPFITNQPDPKDTSGQDSTGGNLIPSNATKENWIKNANTVIPPGEEGAGKTGYENYIDNLKERGFTKIVDGKLVFKKDNIGNEIGSAMLTRFGMADEPKAKVNKIIEDLQRMGGVNAQVTAGDIDPETKEPSIDFASELELGDAPGTFATMGGNFKGFVTPAGNAFPTWEAYINSIMQPFTSTSTQIKNKTKISAGDRLDAENIEKEAKALQDRKDMQQKIKDAEQQQQQEQEQQQSNERDRVRDEYEDKGTVTYNTKDTGGYVTTPNTGQNKPPSERSGYTGSSKETPRTGPNLRFR